MYVNFVKRAFSFFGALLALIVLSPFLLCIALIIMIKLGFPVLFVQERIGKNKKHFRMYKFRTMSNERDENGSLLPDYLRLTKFGLFLRSMSIDELPALLNIIKGEMSFIGPRPMPITYEKYFNDVECKRFKVRGGLSGWAQVNGRNSLDWDKKFEYDVYYVDNLSFGFDVKIFFMTIIKVFKHDDIGIGGIDPLVDFSDYRKKQLSESTKG